MIKSYPSPEKFNDRVDEILEETKQWVLEQCNDVKYACCEDASWMLYFNLVDYFISAFGSMKEYERETGMLLTVAYGYVVPPIDQRDGIALDSLNHVWVEMGAFILDPTEMQYSFPLTPDDYVTQDVDWNEFV